MKLSISNIAWSSESDRIVYDFMSEYGISGLEIAPTRIFPLSPYDQCAEARTWAKSLKKQYGYCISSMQSIWYGRQEKIFGVAEERQLLIQYTKKAINFAQELDCSNLVFGCPRNRSIPKEIPADTVMDIAVVFFRELGEYALAHGTVIGMEANPPIYNTNYINDTASAIELVKKVDSEGFRLNLDVGTMVENGEDISTLQGNVSLINHVHISEPGLRPIQKRDLHRELMTLLAQNRYDRFVSIEMGKTDDIITVKEAVKYLNILYTANDCEGL